MKKIVCLLLAVLMTLGLTSCGKKETPVDDTNITEPVIKIDKVEHDDDYYFATVKKDTFTAPSETTAPDETESTTPTETEATEPTVSETEPATEPTTPTIKEPEYVTPVLTVLDTDKCSMVDLRQRPYRTSLSSEYQEIANQFFAFADTRSRGELPYRFSSFNELHAFNDAFKDAYGFTPSYDAGFNDMAKRDYIQVIVYGDFMDDDRAKENELQNNISAATFYINSAVASLGISSNTTVYDAVKKIDNYICSNFSYGRHCDVDDVSYRKEGNQNNLSRYAAICHGFNYGKLICSGYAEIFKEMCLSVGIDARILCGDSSEGNHAWNRVVFSDGTSRYIDSCWNDTTGSKNYLLLTYDAMSQEHWNGAE